MNSYAAGLMALVGGYDDTPETSVSRTDKKADFLVWGRRAAETVRPRTGKDRVNGDGGKGKSLVPRPGMEGPSLGQVPVFDDESF